MQSVPQAPPPVVVQQGQAATAFAAFPKIADGSNHFIVMGLSVTGERKLVEAARVKLVSEGWPAEYVTDRSGTTVLGIGAERRTVQALAALAQRLKGKEFGAVDASLLTIPDPSFIR